MKTIKHFLTNKGYHSADGGLISSKQTLVEVFNTSYIEIVKISPGNKTLSSEYPSDSECDELMVKAIISKYCTAPSVEKIRESFQLEKGFVLPPASIGEIKKN